jgi:hypothetical protein
VSVHHNFGVKLNAFDIQRFVAHAHNYIPSLWRWPINGKRRFALNGA